MYHAPEKLSISFNKSPCLINSSSSNMTASSNSDRILTAASLLRRSVSPPSSVIPMVVDKTAATSSAPHSPSPVGSSISKENPNSQQSGGVPSPTYSQVISSIFLKNLGFLMDFCHFGYFLGSLENFWELMDISKENQNNQMSGNMYFLTYFLKFRPFCKHFDGIWYFCQFFASFGSLTLPSGQLDL